MEAKSIFKKMMVCLDGSGMAEEILPYATEQALRFRSRVILFQAYIVPSATIAAEIQAGAPIGPDLMREGDKKSKKSAEDYLEGVAGPMREKGLDVVSVAVPGNAAELIVDHALKEEVDLIALVTHGHSGLGRVVFGSVAEQVLKKSGRPILLVKPAEKKFLRGYKQDLGGDNI